MKHQLDSIKTLARQGKNNKQIATALNSAGVTTVRGQKFSKEYVQHLISKYQFRAPVPHVKTVVLRKAKSKIPAVENLAKHVLRASIADSKKVALLNELL